MQPSTLLFCSRIVVWQADMCLVHLHMFCCLFKRSSYVLYYVPLTHKHCDLLLPRPLLSMRGALAAGDGAAAAACASAACACPGDCTPAVVTTNVFPVVCPYMSATVQRVQMQCFIVALCDERYSFSICIHVSTVWGYLVCLG